jgi:SPFH domain / Band 7 family
VKNFRRFAVLPAVAVVAAACSIGNTTASEVALQYGGGPFDSRTFVACVPSGTRSIDDVNDDHYYYPSGQRDFTFSADQGADAPQLTSATKDPTEITVSGTVKFTLNTNCDKFTDPSGKEWPGGKLQMFHELIASKYDAAPDDGGEPMKDGWKGLLRNYIGAAIDRAVDNEALKYGYLDLYTNVDRKAAWERDVLAQIPAILKSLTQGVDLIEINAVLLQKPSVAGQIVGGFAEKQAAELRAQAVEIDKQAASQFPGGIAAYQAYQQQQAINQAIKDGKVQVLPVPQGSSIIVAPK